MLTREQNKECLSWIKAFLEALLAGRPMNRIREHKLCQFDLRSPRASRVKPKPQDIALTLKRKTNIDSVHVKPNSYNNTKLSAEAIKQQIQLHAFINRTKK